MPSVHHEAILDLFRERVTLAPELLSESLGIELPPYTEVRTEDANLTQIVPTEYRADLVVLLLDGRPVHGIVVEVQLAPDADKRYSWPLYGAALRAKLRCPVSVLVVTPDDAVARWAARPIEIGPSGSVFVPLVLGPGAVPRVTRDRPPKAPELAILSALARANDPDGLATVLAALDGAATLDEPRAGLYADLVMASLSEAVAKELEAMVLTGKYELQSDFAKRYFAEGREEGREQGREEGREQGREEGREEGREQGREQGREEGREQGREEGRAEASAAMLLRVVEKRGLELSGAQRSRVLGCRDVAQLERWLDRALEAADGDELFDED